jgi:hypothetical protein
VLSTPSYSSRLANMVQHSLIGAALSDHAVVVGGTFSGDAKPPGLDIYHGVDRLGT